MATDQLPVGMLDELVPIPCGVGGSSRSGFAQVCRGPFLEVLTTEPPLRMASRFLYSLLAVLADGRTGEVECSQEGLAHQLGVSRGAVRNAVRELEARDVIACKWRRGGLGVVTVRNYTSVMRLSEPYRQVWARRRLVAERTTERVVTIRETTTERLVIDAEGGQS